MSLINYIQFEDKNVDEESSLGTITGLNSYFPNQIETIVLTNDSSKTRKKYIHTGVKTTIYFNEKFNINNFASVAKSLNKVLCNFHGTIVLDDNNLGNSIGARIAAMMNIPFFPHISKIIKRNELLVVTRNIAETKVKRKSVIKGDAVITISINGTLNFDNTSEISEKKFLFNSTNSEKYIPNEKKSNSLSYAKIVVAGGKGLQSAENFKALKKLANKLGASVGATKAVTDQGWIDSDKMIGVSNVTVKPDVYYAFGISGAIQHTAGMDQSKHVIAINTDSSAPIFRLADYGIIGDAQLIIKKLNERL